LHGVRDLSQFGAAGGEPGLVFRGRNLGRQPLLFGLALLTQGLFLLVPAPDSRHALSQFGDELAGQRTPDQTTQVGDRAGMHRVRLDPGTQFVEQGLGVRRAAPDQDKRRLPFFGEQGFRQNQITTTLRVSLARDDLRCEWLLY